MIAMLISDTVLLLTLFTVLCYNINFSYMMLYKNRSSKHCPDSVEHSHYSTHLKICIISLFGSFCAVILQTFHLVIQNFEVLVHISTINIIEMGLNVCYFILLTAFVIMIKHLTDEENPEHKFHYIYVPMGVLKNRSSNEF